MTDLEQIEALEKINEDLQNVCDTYKKATRNWIISITLWLIYLAIQISELLPRLLQRLK